MFNDFKRYAQEMRAFDFKPMFSGVNAIGSLKDYMREKKIDIVHTHLYGADFIGTIAAMLAGVPYKISTVHGYNFNALDRLDLRNMKNFVCSTVYRGIYIPDDEVIAVSEAVKRDLAERPGIRVRKNKIRVIYDGIDLEMPRGIGEDRVHEAGNNFSGGVYSSVGMIANFDRIKGHHIMLKAIPIIKKELKNVRFLFAGQGKERSRLEQMALRLGVAGDIIFEDAREDINGIISQCDLIVSPSLSEGLSLAVLEAMALAKPVVAADIGGIPEAVEDGKTGLLVPPRDHRN
jgi:glycosyltransferase involved in cell wall biosynthesis